MIDSACITDLQSYIKRRVAYARYRIARDYHKTAITDIDTMSDGTVRIKMVITPETVPATITRVELYNSDGELWAHQACNITIQQASSGILFWFDISLLDGGN